MIADDEKRLNYLLDVVEITHVHAGILINNCCLYVVIDIACYYHKLINWCIIALKVVLIVSI